MSYGPHTDLRAGQQGLKEAVAASGRLDISVLDTRSTLLLVVIVVHVALSQRCRAGSSFTERHYRVPWFVFFGFFFNGDGGEWGGGEERGDRDRQANKRKRN